MLDLEGIREFVAVARFGSFTRAAARLNCSKSYLSKKVKSLERRLGVLLFERNTRDLQLTDTGESYYTRCAAVLAELESATSAATAAGHLPHGLLKVHVAASIGEITTAGIFAEFSTLYSQLTLHLDFDSRPLETIPDEYDVLITRGILKDSALVAHKLGESDFDLYASPAYYQRHGMPECLEDLARHRCLVDGSGSWWFGRGAEATEVRVEGGLKSNRGTLLLRCALRGMGITQQSRHPLRNLVEEGALLAVPGDWACWRAGWYALFHRRTPEVPKVRLLVDFLAEHFARPADFRLLDRADC